MYIYINIYIYENDIYTMKSNSDVNTSFNIFLDTFSNLYDTHCLFISHTIKKK